MSVSSIQHPSQSYLLAAPLNPRLPLLQRIANVAFHILTLGIPLAIYKLFAYCSVVLQERRDRNAYAAVIELQEKALESVRRGGQIPEISPLGRQALEFVQSELLKQPSTQPRYISSFYEYVREPKENMAKLTLLWDRLYVDFEHAIKNAGDNPWANLDVLRIADTCMKVAYAISIQTLEDLSEYAGDEMVKTLVEGDSYHSRTFSYCLQVYHWLRNEVQISEDGLFEPVERLHAKDFYKPGTWRNQWNALYNEFCVRIRMYIDVEELRKDNDRLANMIKMDVSETLYKP